MFTNERKINNLIQKKSLFLLISSSFRLTSCYSICTLIAIGVDREIFFVAVPRNCVLFFAFDSKINFRNMSGIRPSRQFKKIRNINKFIIVIDENKNRFRAAKIQ